MKIRLAVMTLAVSMVAVAASAAEVSEADVLKPALAMARRVVVSHRVAPAILSEETRGGADHFATEWIYDHAGKLVASDISAAYVRENRSRIDVTAAAPEGMKLADLSGFESGNSYDWKAFSETYPNAHSIVVISRPAFDSLGATALVRYDIVTPTDAWTSFQMFEKQPIDGSWKATRGAMGTLATFYRTDIHTHPPEKCLVPRDNPVAAP